MEVKDIVKGIKRIAERAAKHSEDVQLIGVACIEQVQQHGNVTYLNQLYLSLGKGDKDALGRWLLAFGGVKANLVKETKAAMPFRTDKELMATADPEAASGVLWTEYHAEPKSIARLADEGKAVNALIEKLLKGEGFKDTEKARKIGAALSAAMAAL